MPLQKPSLPFSARNRGAQSQIDNDFPRTARAGVVIIVSPKEGPRQWLPGAPVRIGLHPPRND